MASFSVEDFSGNGILKDLLQRCWKKEALEIRSYLHDRALLQYGEKLEASGKCLPELLSLSTEDLSSHFGMKRDHMARFMDRTSACEDPRLKSYAPLTARKMNSAVSRNNSNFKSYASVSSKKMQTSSGMNSDKSIEQSLADFKLKDGYIFKGIAAAGPAEPRACGCVQPPPVVTVLPLILLLKKSWFRN
ncbi:hypothetical protein OIU77_014035 [Salix suchowensis]|uniref:Uncharacterized protein n=1 Tax=Salix suchowensis TaxID=1278906 RepID=A0ABQ8ZXI3_9ROSI|nr:hypothetical protein OIU77_014035 [Salix suchowensis]